MSFDLLVHQGIQGLVETMRHLHFPLMIGTFVVGAILRCLVYWTVRRHEWFAREFEGRVGAYLDKEGAGAEESVSFYVVSKRLLERTYYEVFEHRDRNRRGRADAIMALGDRVFLIKQGCAWLIRDILNQIRFLKYGSQPPKLLNITKNTFSKNPCFNRVFGLIPIVSANDLLNALPGLFVIGGIFGTFLGVMKGLPELGGMDLNDAAKTKDVMDKFLVQISLSMGASLMGIMFSVLMTVLNTMLSPEREFVAVVERFENSLDLLWNRAHTNEVPRGLPKFDEHRDPVEALAEAAINQELDKRKTKDVAPQAS
jgi:hypothetical protein